MHPLDSRSLPILERELSALYFRRNVLADNLANVATPEFKRSDVVFERELRESLFPDPKKMTRGYLTHKRHIPFYEPKDPMKVQAKVYVDYTSKMRNDGNNVDIDLESARILKNTLHIRGVTRALLHHFRMMNMVTR